MAFKPTPTQQKAIETRGNILVSAAAGSGKTAVLVERVVQMLTDKTSPVGADRLLIVTFTNAAAAEMRTRIEKRLYEEIQKYPNDQNLQRQKYLLRNADICTIDSFCIKLVRENFEKCGVEPDFKISDGSGQSNVENQVMTELIAEQLDSPTSEFLRLLELCNCEYDEKNLTDLISRIYLYSQQLPFPRNFIDGLLLPYEMEFAPGNVWYDMAFGFVKKCISLFKKHAEKMCEFAPYVNKNTDKYMAYADAFIQMADDFETLEKTNDWDTVSERLVNLSFDRMPSCEKDDPNGEKVKNHQKRAKETIGELREIFRFSREVVQNNITENHASIKLLVTLINNYGERLFEAFKRENSFTFYNTEQLALNLLCEYKDGKIVIRDEAMDLCKRYAEVLVDEFQDVNDLQNMLFYVLSNREEKLFVVGDIKQSIYGFRGSNPENFLNKKNSYAHIDQAQDGQSKKIILSDNFRSRQGVCDAVNFFFTELFAGQCGDIIYDCEEQLNAAGTFPASDAITAEVLVVDKYDDDSEDSLLQTEAQKIADYIISIMASGDVISSGDGLRKAQYGDFAILLDKVKDKAGVIADVLNSRGIPVSLSGESFLESVEISTVMSLLQVIDNPKCDVELLEIMMSPIFAFTAEEMAQIRVAHRYGPLYSAVVAYSEAGDKKTSNFVEKMTEFRRDAVVLSVDRLISKLIHSTDILNMMSSLDGGKARRSNLFSLISYAKSYNERANGGVYGFIKYINSLPDNAFKVGNNSGENSVRIMSMHNSKGLQFPVCIVANLSSKINNADSISRILFSEKAGIAFKYYDEAMAYDIEMLGHALMSDVARVRTVEEKLRLLYVAMTRAIDRLCLVCASNNLDRKLENLSSLLQDKAPYVSAEFLEKSSCMGDWILSCLLVHPNGSVLREYADVKAPMVASDANIKITITNSDNQQLNAVEHEQSKQEIQCDTVLAQKMAENFNYEYPYEVLRHLQAKASVSRLVHSAEDDRFDFVQRPNFMSDNKLAGAARGTAMHHIMQFIALTPSVDVDAEIERLLEWKFITQQEAESVNIDAIKSFFNSSLYNRIILSPTVKREMRFMTEIPAKSIDPTLEIAVDDANIIVQGAVDLCFEEEDGIVVLDFKTDKVDDISQLVDCYGEQLEIYSTAAQKIFNKPIKEKIIYSFHLGESITF